MPSGFVRRGILCLFVVGLLGSSRPLRAADRPLRALILVGEEDAAGGGTAPILRRILADSGRFDVRVTEAPAGLSARTLDGFDIVIDDGAHLPEGGESEAALAAFVGSGKGLVVAHGAFLGPPFPAYWPVGVDGGRLSGVTFLGVQVVRPDHPIVRGMGRDFLTPDALPSDMRARPGAEVIAEAAAIDGGSAPGGPVLTASQHGKGRVVGLALGHDPSALHERRVAALFARGCEWAATGAVTLPPEWVPPETAPGAIRGLLITGGHDHEAAFYSLFEGREGLDRLPVDTAANAFKDDLRGKYDVLILYDFTREIDEAARKNLRDFVEAGKGIVVLHHALLDFQTWTWWSEEVVGGRYRLQREGGSPSSSVKNDQEIRAFPAGPHPVLDGIAPFQITDEAYKNLAMSPEIRPLLTTDNPTSDANLAWIGPCATSRVVAIQLGHGQSAFGHPSYRALVHNAVRWAAGKTE